MRDNSVDLVGNLPATLRLPLMEATEEEILLPDPRYPTLQHAVDALIPGGRLALGEGEHVGGVTITQQIDIVGVFGANTVVRPPSEVAPGLSLVAGAELFLEGLAITGGSAGVLAGADARAAIIDSNIKGNSSFGINVRDTAHATIQGSSIAGSGWGIVVEGFSQANIVNSSIEGNQNGILVAGSAQASIEDSLIEENETHGIALGSNATGSIVGTTIERNQDGISVRSLAQATVKGSTIQDNRVVGISLWDSTQTTVESSRIRGNGRYGLYIGVLAVATITDCAISENRQYGIVLSRSSHLSIERTEITDNGCYGIALHESPCFIWMGRFTGYVTGYGNNIPGVDEEDGHTLGAVCPRQLSFLMADEGGELDRRE